MTESEARRRAELICLEMRDIRDFKLDYGQWTALIDAIAAALLEAANEEKP